MNQRRHLSLVAAAATLMAAAPLHVLFNDWSWLVESVFVIAVVCAVSIGARALRMPTWSQPVVGLAAVLVVTTLVSARGQAIAGLIPGPAAWQQFSSLLSVAGDDIRTQGIPIDSDPGLLLLVTAGIGTVMVLVDFFAIGLHKPAAAGLPLLAIYAVPVAIDQSSIDFLSFAIGAAGYLWLLVTDNVDKVRLFGRRFTGEGKGVDMWEPSPLAAVGRRVAVGCVALAILVPLAVPGFNTTLVGVLGTVGGSGNGSGNCPKCKPSNTVDLFASLTGQLNLNRDTVMAQVTTTSTSPKFFRFAVADQLTRNGFLTTASNGQSIGAGLPTVDLSNAGISYTKYDANVTIQNLSLQYLPIYGAPVNGTVKGVSDDWRYDQDSDVIFSNSKNVQTVKNMPYSFSYEEPTYNVAALKTAPPIQPDDPALRNLTTVPQTVTQVQKIINDPSTQANDEYDRVFNLYKWFDNAHGFSYSLTTKDGTTGSDIGNFLTQKQGFCVQYATALAWLVRAAGYPARVAFGFNAGTQGANGVWTFTNKDLHAWTEVYFPTFGWVPFDATPALGNPTYSTWAGDPNSQISQNNPSTGPGEDITPGSSLHPGAGPTNHATPGGGAGTGGDSSETWWTLGTILALLALASIPLAVRTRLRHVRTSGGSAVAVAPRSDGEIGVLAEDGTIITAQRSRVHAVWEEFVDTLVDYGIGVDPTETPRAAAERVAATPYLSELVVDDVRQLGQAEERARYAARPGATQSFAAALRRIRRAFADRAPLRTRLRAQLLPPSVTGRWRTATISAMASTSAWMQGIRDNVVRALSVRRRLASSKQ